MSKKQVKVVTIRDVDDIPEGSVFNAKLEVEDGVEYWTGLWSSMRGSYTISVPADACEEWDEALHDPMKGYWRKRYAEDAAQDKEGELPKLFLEHSMRDIREGMKADERRAGDNELSLERSARWLRALEAYYAKHYGSAE
jgi:hypothetical protein